ncbi:MAG: MlaE family lipid ABC transporter permease subunit [Hyphomicrobiaceae bacterium]|nr:MlaE family lipid ABC transporter permease subunit [Hyphomicrobiaceae bacterium]
MASDALLSGTLKEGRLELVAGGSWTALRAGELEARLEEWMEQASAASSVSLEMSQVGAFDTYGAWLVERLRREAGLRGLTFVVTGQAQQGLKLLEDMQGRNLQAQEAAAPDFSFVRAVRGGISNIGRAVHGVWSDVRSFNNMLGTLSAAFFRAVVQPRRFRFTASVHQLDRVGLRAVPIILLITFLIGAIIAQQGFFHFRKFGADVYVVDMVGILVLRELGVLLVAIMVAGRSGSAFTAELGSMKMREEIDALKTMGLDPVEILILPRVLVLIIAMPLLTFLGAMAALYGGGLVAFAYGGMGSDIFVARLKEAINITHFQVGMIKAPFMGAVIGIIACMEGLKVQGSAASLGHHTTRSVVKSIFMVIVLDGLFAIFFAAIGM